MNSEKDFAVIFDMDGVLIDSTKSNWDSFNVLLAPKINFDKTLIKRYLGQSLRDQIALWKKEHDVDVGDVEEFTKKANAIQIEILKADMKPNKELLQLLEELKEKNVPIAVGTSSQRPRTESMISLFALEKYFNTLVTASDVIEHKPNPHVFLEAAKRLGVSPERCVVIEDAASGIEAAKRGNMKAIGFLTEWNSREELRNADLIISGFEELSYEKLEELFD